MTLKKKEKKTRTKPQDQDFFLYNTHEDEQEVKLQFGNPKNDLPKDSFSFYTDFDSYN